MTLASRLHTVGTERPSGEETLKDYRSLCDLMAGFAFTLGLAWDKIPVPPGHTFVHYLEEWEQWESVFTSKSFRSVDVRSPIFDDAPIMENMIGVAALYYFPAFVSAAATTLEQGVAIEFESWWEELCEQLNDQDFLRSAAVFAGISPESVLGPAQQIVDIFQRNIRIRELLLPE